MMELHSVLCFVFLGTLFSCFYLYECVSITFCKYKQHTLFQKEVCFLDKQYVLHIRSIVPNAMKNDAYANFDIYIWCFRMDFFFK